MKKLLALTAALLISTTSFAGVTEVYNAIDNNPDAAATHIDKKAAELKNKIDGKLTKLKTKAAEKSVSALTSQESLKSQLEEKLSSLVASGKGNSSKADEIRAEIESLTKLINAAQQ